MASCTTNIEQFLAENGELSVSEKYKQLMEDSLGDGSLYERTKDTFQQLFKELNVSESERLQLVATNVANIANNISAQAMSTALAWATSERDGAYQLAQVKAQTELTLAQKELTAEEVCRAQNETQLSAAQTAEILASTIRQDALNAVQVDLSKAQKYTTLAEAYRKSGVVNIATDTDSVEKGLTGDTNGYTNTQDSFLQRQEQSFEDSKRNWAANSSAAMISGLLSSEIPISETDTAFLLWKSSMEYLTQTQP